MVDPPKTLTCPRCSTANQLTDDTCLGCKLPLGPIRAALEAASAASLPSFTAESTSDPAEPVPARPAIQTRNEQQSLGELVGTQQRLIRRAADLKEVVATRFFDQLSASGIKDMELSTGQLTISGSDGRSEARDCGFAHRDLGGGALATVAVYIAPLGSDLVVEWRQFDRTPPDTRKPWGLILGLMDFFGMFIFAMILFQASMVFVVIWTAVFGASAAVAGARIGAMIEGSHRPPTLSEFQHHDSRAFHRAVEEALLEAITQAGVERGQIERVGGSSLRLRSSRRP